MFNTTTTTMTNLHLFIKYKKGQPYYCYLEDGIQYQMDFKSLLRLKEFVTNRKNVNNSVLPINEWYKQLQREDKKKVIVAINRSYSIKVQESYY